jgi:tripartite-type tricarboxylate transporter receptor subunit TctC
VINTLNTATNEILKEPEVQQAYAKLQVGTRLVSPAELKTFMADETKKWGEVIKAAGIKAE